jgi:CheY-like chemotaxis protein
MAKILVADDDKLVSSFVEKILKSYGYSVEVVHNGQSALEAWSENHQLLITDYEMPGLNGLQLTKSIRDTGDDRPIVLMSGGLFDSNILDSYGVNAFFHKPIKLADFLKEVRNLLNAKG